MTVPALSTHEVQDAVDRYLHIREDADAGRGGWDDLAQVFTDDVVYVDPAWGRVDGIENLIDFLDRSMRGLDGWSFPVDTTAISGARVMVHWTQRLPGERADGTPYQQSGMSMLLYSAGGKFRYCEDILNMAHVMADIAESGWRPGPGFTAPPPRAQWDVARSFL